METVKESQMLLIDAHLDLAMNALNWNRDLTRGVTEIRLRERDMKEKGRGAGTVALPELRRGRVAVTVATLIARVAHETNDFVGYDSQDICCAMAMGQLAYYHVLEKHGHLRILDDWSSLSAHFEVWESASQEDKPPVGLVLSMEGADPILDPDDVPTWRRRGLRIVGLSHYGLSTYAHGTGTEGGLTDRARPLLQALDEAGMILDTTHLADQSFWEALEIFPGPVLASHSNCRALVPDHRQFSDEQIRALLDRNAVIGVALDAWMLQPGWIKGVTTNENVSLAHVVDHIDHICQLAGNSKHVAIGSDLDGGFGTEQSPCDLDTIADLQRIPQLLEARGYSESDIKGVMHENWLGFLRRSWQASGQ